MQVKLSVKALLELGVLEVERTYNFSGFCAMVGDHKLPFPSTWKPLMRWTNHFDVHIVQVRDQSPECMRVKPLNALFDHHMRLCLQNMRYPHDEWNRGLTAPALVLANRAPLFATITSSPNVKLVFEPSADVPIDVTLLIVMVTMALGR